MSSIASDARAARRTPPRAEASGLHRRLRYALVVALIGALAGCGTTPTSRKGGFYQDDGPPDRTLTNPNQIADAVPRVEPFSQSANRPYNALGRSYRPMTEDKPYRARGLASWYGRQFHGSKTSSGEIYDMFAATAAHTTLPIPSYARVTNTRTGASLIVRINDRGPFKPDRVIDLSYAAAVKLGIAAAGTGEVEVVRLTFDDIRAMKHDDARAPAAPAVASALPGAQPSAPVVGVPPAAPSAGGPVVAAAASPAPVSPAPTVLPPLAAPSASPPAAPVTGSAAAVQTPSTAQPPPTAAPAPLAPAAPPVATTSAGADTGGRWAVQVGAFQLQANADAMRDRVAVQMQQAGSELAAHRAPRVERDGSIFRVLVGALADRAAAQALAQQLAQLLGRETFPLMR